MPKNSIGSTNDILKDNQKTENKVELFMAYYIGKLSKDVHHKVVRQCSQKQGKKENQIAT